MSFFVIMHKLRDGHFSDECSQSCDKSKKHRIGVPLAQKVEKNVRRERRQEDRCDGVLSPSNRPRPILGTDATIVASPCIDLDTL